VLIQHNTILQYTVDQKNMQICTKVFALINNISEYTYKFVCTTVYILVDTRILMLMSVLIVVQSPNLFFQKIYTQYTRFYHIPNIKIVY